MIEVHPRQARFQMDTADMRRAPRRESVAKTASEGQSTRLRTRFEKNFASPGCMLRSAFLHLLHTRHPLPSTSRGTFNRWRIAKYFTLSSSSTGFKMVQSSVLGFPRMGVLRDLKKANEAYWADKLSQQELLAEGKRLRLAHWKIQKDAGVDIIPSNDFAFYDHVLDHIQLFNVSRTKPN